jgi:hypothetical protein
MCTWLLGTWLDDLSATDEGTLKVVQEDLEPQAATAAPNTISSLNARLDGKSWSFAAENKGPTAFFYINDNGICDSTEEFKYT